jgi:hypothetical protein
MRPAGRPMDGRRGSGIGHPHPTEPLEGGSFHPVKASGRHIDVRSPREDRRPGSSLGEGDRREGGGMRPPRRRAPGTAAVTPDYTRYLRDIAATAAPPLPILRMDRPRWDTVGAVRTDGPRAARTADRDRRGHPRRCVRASMLPRAPAARPWPRWRPRGWSSRSSPAARWPARRGPAAWRRRREAASARPRPRRAPRPHPRRRRLPRRAPHPRRRRHPRRGPAALPHRRRHRRRRRHPLRPPPPPAARRTRAPPPAPARPRTRRS